MLLLSCISLMASFWPVVIMDDDHDHHDNDNEHHVIDNDNHDDVSHNNIDNSSLQQPLLSDYDRHNSDQEESIVLQLQETSPIIIADDSNNCLNNNDNNNKNNNNDNKKTKNTSSTHHSSTTTKNTATRMNGTRRLLQLVSKEVQYLYIGCIVLLIRLPFSLCIPHYISTILYALSQQQYNVAKQDIYCLLIIGTIDSIFDFWCVFLFGYTNQRIVYHLRYDLFIKLIHQEMNFFDNTNTGELTSRLNSDCNEMANDLTWFFRFSIESIVRIIGISIYMCIRCPILSIYVLCIIPIVAIINKVYNEYLKHNVIAIQDSIAHSNSIAYETLLNIKTVIGLSTEHIESNKYHNRIHKQYTLNIRQLFITGIYYMGMYMNKMYLCV